MKFAKGYNQQSVKNYVNATLADLDKQPHCACSTSVSTWADIYGRHICQNCGKPIKTSGSTLITIPYYFYEQD